MYVLGIVGSKRRSGNCDILVRTVLKQCRSLGADVKIVYLDELNIETCRGCLACALRGRCSQKDDMQHLLDLMLGAQSLVVAAPTYLFSPSGIIKTIIDRALMLSAHLSDVDVSRPAVTISVAGNQLWNPLGIEFLNQFCFAYAFTVVDYQEAYAPGPGEVLLDNDNIDSAKNLAAKLVDKQPVPRPAEQNQCPACYSRSFRFLKNDQIQCSFCLTTGVISNQRLQFGTYEDNFWTPQHRKQHLKDWIVVTRDRYLEHRKRLKENLKRFKNEQKGASD